MTLNEVIETVKKNPQAFPKGLDTSREEVRDFLEYVSVEAVAEKFGRDASMLVAVAENIVCKSQREVEEACDAVRESLSELRNASLLAVAEASR